jgi:hypothetical protein
MRACRPRVLSAEDPEGGEWPVGLWHRLLIDSGVPFGGRVLVIGCRHPELVAALDACAFEVEGVDDRHNVVETASRLFPKFRFTFSRLDDLLSVPNCSFDLVLVHDVEAYRHDLLDLSARLATANVLASLKPRGQLFVIRRMIGESELSVGHRGDCWTKHLSCFPGTTETAAFRDGWFTRATWNWIRGRTARAAHLVVRHELPLELLPRDAWIRCARRGQSLGRGACCDSAAELSHAEPLRRAA